MTQSYPVPRKLLRSNRLLFLKFREFLLPMMITYVAISLNEFVDSMLVSRLLGSNALAIVSLGTPLMFVIAALYGLLGSGGATAYGIALGHRDHEKAGEVLTVTLLASLTASVLMVGLGTVFFSPLSKLLCSNPDLRPAFTSYLRVMLLSAPLLIVILSFTSFLPASGHPGLATAVNLTANGVNLVMDYVYIRLFHMGVEGAAWATLTGYVCAAALLILAHLSKKLRLCLSRNPVRSLPSLSKVLKLGGPDAMTQVGLCLQFAVCNRLAMACAGVDALVALSISMQTISVLSVFTGTMIGSSSPIIAVLHGQRDYSGEASLLKLSLAGVLAIATIGTLGFEFFASQAVWFYRITDPKQAAMVIHAMQIFVLLHVPRYTLITYCRYLKVIGLANYATLVSAMNDFGAILPIAWLLTRLLGINGLWIAFPLTSYLLLLFVLMRNCSLERQSKGRLRGILLLEHEEETEPVLDVTITKDAEDISSVSERLQKLCEDRGMDKTHAVLSALAVEEICVYAANKKKQDAYMDVLVRVYQDNVEIDFRSLGTPFDPRVDVEDDLQENIRILRSIAAAIENEYILGMNSTRIRISTGTRFECETSPPETEGGKRWKESD